MQYAGERLHYRVKRDDQQGQAGQRDVDITPGTNDETSALLALQRERQLLASLQGRVSALEIGRFARVKLRHRCAQAGARVEGLQAIGFERLRLARAQALDLIFQFKYALLDGAGNAG